MWGFFKLDGCCIALWRNDEADSNLIRVSLYSHYSFPSFLQELVRQLYRRPKATLSLMESEASRAGPGSMSQLMRWLWPLTAAPQRSFRANAMWLHKHLAALVLSGSGAGKSPQQLKHGLWLLVEGPDRVSLSSWSMAEFFKGGLHLRIPSQSAVMHSEWSNCQQVGENPHRCHQRSG